MRGQDQSRGYRIEDSHHPVRRALVVVARLGQIPHRSRVESTVDVRKEEEVVVVGSDVDYTLARAVAEEHPELLYFLYQSHALLLLLDLGREDLLRRLLFVASVLVPFDQPFVPASSSVVAHHLPPFQRRRLHPRRAASSMDSPDFASRIGLDI